MKPQYAYFSIGSTQVNFLEPEIRTDPALGYSARVFQSLAWTPIVDSYKNIFLNFYC